MHATAHRFEPASYTQLQHGDRVQIPQMNRDVFIRWSWRILTVDYVDWIRDDRTALMLHLTQPAIPSGDRFTLIVGRATIETGVRRVIGPTLASSKEQPMPTFTNEQIDEIRARLASPDLGATELREIAVTLLADNDAQHGEVERWRESYRIVKGLSDDELNAMIAADDAAEAHPRPCWFPHEACVCGD
jgi:hypothetical protein